MTNNYSDKIAKWALSNPGKLWEDNPRAAAVRQWLRVNEPKKLIELYNSEPEHIKKRIDKRFLPDGVAKEMFKNNVRSVIDSSGRNIFKVVDNVTGFIPGPVGAINWIGHLGSDIITGNPYKAARDILMSAAVGASGKLVSRIGRRLLKNARSGRGVNSGMHGESNGHIDVQPVEVSAGRDLTETVSLPNEAKNIIDDRYGNLRLIRNIRGVPYGNLENGITLAPQKNIFGNFTTDLPFRLHYDYQSMPGGEVMLVDPKALSGKTPWNIDVMDTFFRANDLTGVDPKYITFVSGNESYLDQARKLGMKTETSQELIDEYFKLVRKNGDNFWGRSHPTMLKDYRIAMDNAITKIGRPTAEEYRNLEKMTGLKSGISSDVEYGINDLMSAKLSVTSDYVDDILRTTDSWIAFPDGRTFNAFDFRKKIAPFVSREALPYKNVYYNPFPTAEDDLLKKIGGHGHQEYYDIYDKPLEYMFNEYVNSKPLKKKGGPLSRNERLAKLVYRINSTSNADFVKRLLDEKRKVLKNSDGTVSTHELGYVDDGNGNAVVFPEVQSSGDSLARFHFPQSLNRAIQNRDTIQMNVPDAELFTAGYKEFYPGFNKYETGGLVERYGSDKVRDALLRIRGQHRFDGNSEDGSLIMRTDNNGNLVDSIETAIITSELPAKFNGSQAAARRYAEAEKFGRKVINKTNKIAPYVFEGLLTTASLPYAITSGLIGGLKRLPKVLANPALAKTKIGAALATYADAYGLVSGARELSNDVNKVIDGDYKISDVPKTLLDATILVPGSSIITNPDNFLVAKNTIRDFASDPLRPIRDIKTGIDNIKIYSSAVKDRDNIREGLKYALFKYNKTYEKLTDNDILNFGPQYKDWLVRSNPLPTRLPMVRIYSPFESIFHSRILGSYNKPMKRVSMNPYHYSFLKTAWSNPKEAVNNMIGVAAHEGSHWTHMGLSDAGVRLSIPGYKYYIANYSHPLYKDVLSKFWKLDTAWRRSPEEYVAEMTNYQFLNSIPAGAPYEKWNPDARYMVNKSLSKRFGFPMDETEYITKSLSDYGFSNGGKLR